MATDHPVSRLQRLSGRVCKQSDDNAIWSKLKVVHQTLWKAQLHSGILDLLCLETNLSCQGDCCRCRCIPSTAHNLSLKSTSSLQSHLLPKAVPLFASQAVQTKIVTSTQQIIVICRPQQTILDLGEVLFMHGAFLLPQGLSLKS